MKEIITTGIVLAIDNIDTDQIIPAKFLKATDKKGFGKNLFYNWRYNIDGTDNQEFAFTKYPKGEVLIVGNNFGCGSSREHAAWAIADYGIKAIISSQFADIFKGNALNNSILPIELKADEVDTIQSFVSKNKNAQIKINLESQSVQIPELDFKSSFEIDALKKHFLMEGLSEIEYLIGMHEEINAFETTHES
jgi:3-isopropylmalate/(R)-2-methylmalate dehydratase small subunit